MTDIQFSAFQLFVKGYKSSSTRITFFGALNSELGWDSSFCSGKRMKLVVAKQKLVYRSHTTQACLKHVCISNCVINLDVVQLSVAA